MNQYIGTKVITAKPMPLGEYNGYRGWAMPPNEDPTRKGYLVEYAPDPSSEPNHPDHAGYISWSPKEVFEKAYRPVTGLTFGAAIEALKAGKRVCRAGWNGKGLFVFRQVPAEIPAEVVPNMQSLPGSVKAEFARRGGDIRYSNQLALVKPDNTINGWAPSVADALAEDWEILE